MRGERNSTRIFVTALCLVIVSASLFGQEDREYIRKGNRLYKKSEYAGSEGMYRRAQEQAKSGNDAIFNLGDALYRQGRFSEASEEFSRAVKTGETDSLKRADGLYNLGNSLLKDQKFSESINAYINSLRLNPGNLQAKYNLVYAQDQLKKEQEQKDQNQDQQDQEQKDDQQQKQDGEKKDDQQDKQDQQQNEDQKQQDQQSQPKENEISREDAKRLLDALAAREKDAQEKMQRDKAAKAKVRVIKNW